MKKKILVLALISQFVFGQSINDKILTIEYDEYRIYTKGFINLDAGTLIVSKDYSYYKSQVQKKITDNFVADESAIMFKTNRGNTEILPEIIVNRQQNSLTELLFEELYLKNFYAVQELIPKMNWKLSTEKKLIGVYSCKKASVEFRGRVYEAWYTLQIPIAVGPWKFNGLPGAILAVEDRSGIYKWQAKLVSINNNISNKELFTKVQINPKFEKLSFHDFDIKKVKKVQDKIQTVKSRNGSRVAQFGMTTTFESDKEPINEFRTQVEYK